MSDFKVVQLLNPFEINVNVNPRGVYDSGATYGIGDSVSYNGNSYIAIQPTIGNLPTNVTYWQLLAQQGIQGPIGTVEIPELLVDPISPVAGQAWVKKNETSTPSALSHTLLHIGLTTPEYIVTIDYVFKYKTQAGPVVGVALS